MEVYYTVSDYDGGQLLVSYMADKFSVFFDIYGYGAAGPTGTRLHRRSMGPNPPILTAGVCPKLILGIPRLPGVEKRRYEELRSITLSDGLNVLTRCNRTGIHHPMEGGKTSLATILFEGLAEAYLMLAIDQSAYLRQI